jgi:DNA-binding NarL/FixJ family response regulator
MAQGKNNAAVAASLMLSERAVEKHINSIFSKLALSARSPTCTAG